VEIYSGKHLMSVESPDPSAGTASASSASRVNGTTSTAQAHGFELQSVNG